MARFTEKFFLVAGSFSSQFEAIVRALKAEDGDVIWLAPMGSTAFPGVQTIKVNMNSIKSLQTAMARVRKRSVHLHGAVNLIDLPEATGFLLTGGSTFGPSLSTVLDPLAKLIHAEVGKMLESGGGSIVNVVGTAGESFGQNSVLDATLRAAVEGMTRSMATEFGPNRVRVNAVVPGVKHEPNGEPPLLDPGDPRRTSPRWTLVQDHEVAAAVIGLVSSDTIAVSGQIIRVA